MLIHPSSPRSANHMNGLCSTSRPELPPEEISKYSPTFQFPKSLLLPLLRPVRMLQDRRLLPGIPRTLHVVICGFPRSGTTLLQLMMESAIPGIRTFGRERRGLEVARCGRRDNAVVLTKRPKDIYLVDELRAFYSSHPAEVRFIAVSRDPRSILTSRHFSNPSRYYVAPTAWRYAFQHWRWACQSDDVLSITYEALMHDPDTAEHQVLRHTGLVATRPFREFPQHIPDQFDDRPLNGVRQLDPQNSHRWKDPEHEPRIREILQAIPELPQVLIELGYEYDTAWTHRYLPDNSRVVA